MARADEGHENSVFCTKISNEFLKNEIIKKILIKRIC